MMMKIEVKLQVAAPMTVIVTMTGTGTMTGNGMMTETETGIRKRTDVIDRISLRHQAQSQW